MKFNIIKDVLKNNIEIFILLFILLSFFAYILIIQNDKEGACVSKPFSLKQPNLIKSPSGYITADITYTKSITENMLQSYVSVVESIESDLRLIKSIIPINFALGVVDNNDLKTNMSVYGKLPNVYLNFSIKNPPLGPTGIPGENAPKYGDTGKMGITGPIGETGYWGTSKNTLY
jgi:hypothetical protein